MRRISVILLISLLALSFNNAIAQTKFAGVILNDYYHVVRDAYSRKFKEVCCRDTHSRKYELYLFDMYSIMEVRSELSEYSDYADYAWLKEIYIQVPNIDAKSFERIIKAYKEKYYFVENVDRNQRIWYKSETMYDCRIHIHYSEGYAHISYLIKDSAKPKNSVGVGDI